MEQVKFSYSLFNSQTEHEFQTVCDTHPLAIVQNTQLAEEISKVAGHKYFDIYVNPSIGLFVAMNGTDRIIATGAWEVI